MEAGEDPGVPNWAALGDTRTGVEAGKKCSLRPKNSDFYLEKQVFQSQTVRESLSYNKDLHLRGARLKAVTRTRRLF